MLDHNNENDLDVGIDLKDELVNQNKFVLANLNLKQNKNKERHRTQSEEDLSQIAEKAAEDQKSHEQIEEEN